MEGKFEMQSGEYRESETLEGPPTSEQKTDTNGHMNTFRKYRSGGDSFWCYAPETGLPVRAETFALLV